MSDDTGQLDADAPHSVKIEFEIVQHNITSFGLDIHNPVFVVSGISIVADRCADNARGHLSGKISIAVEPVPDANMIQRDPSENHVNSG